MDEGGRGSGQIDLARLDDAFYQNPYPQYADWQSRGPVLPLADGGWLLTRHADLSAVYRNRTAFSADKKAAFGPKFGIGTPLYAHHTTSLVFSDPPYHTRVRRQIVGALSPGAIRSLVPGLIALVDGLCERIGRDVLRASTLHESERCAKRDPAEQSFEISVHHVFSFPSGTL